jgi:tRNA G10  N-methylase Trm11
MVRYPRFQQKKRQKNGNCNNENLENLHMKTELKKYLFQTGHGKGLAKAEIEATSGPDSILDEVDDGFVVEDNLPDPIAHLNRLGGVVRITEVLQIGSVDMPLNFEEWVVKGVVTGVEKKEGKIRYGVSMHPKSEHVLTKILKNSKNRLKEELGSNVRFVNKDFQNLSSVQAWHENLLAPGAVELHLFKSETKWYLAKTVAIQDFESYSYRDYDRPARSAKNGMFPPKVAQELINIAVGTMKPSPDFCIYDPFCGSGTVLQEAWLMDFTTQGSDLSMQCVADTKANMDWLKIEGKMEGLPYVFEKDALELTPKDLPEIPFAIVSETTLGPALNKPLPEPELLKVHAELQALYNGFFANLKKIAPKGTIMVFSAPYHRIGNDRRFLENLPEILAEHTEIIPLSDHARPSLFFERKDQLVSREIWKVKIA